MTSTAPRSGTRPEADWTELRARLRAFVARRVRDDSATHDDLVQEILLRIHRGLPRLRQDERLDAFAYQVARNAIADHYRSGRREQPVDPGALDEGAPVGAAEDGDEEEAGRTQLAHCLQPLVEQLNDDYREALLLTDLGSLSQAEAAPRLGLSPPGMRSRVQRGRAQLREALSRCCRVELDAAGQISEVERVGPCECSPRGEIER
jgi:RNA polymerase sigma-70 factor, ECF subfamily